MNEQKVQITAEPQARPDQCLFRYDRTLFAGTFYSSDAEWAKEWAPFASAVLQIEGIRGVRIRNSELLISMGAKPDDWREMARAVGTATREFLENDQDLFQEDALENQTGDDLLRQRAQDVVDTKLNPGLASHGGFVEIVESIGKDLFLNMGGGCQGCSSASSTMSQGVEVAIRDSIPEIGKIVDATDHATGANPYM